MNKTSWGGVAEWYDGMLETSPDSFQAKVILPNLMRLVDPKPSMNVLDVACGQGYFARAFAGANARVTACDISKELIEIAKKKAIPAMAAEGSVNAANAAISYHVAPSHLMPFAKSGEFDIATVILAIQNIEKLSETIEECKRTLKPGGRLILVLNHPAFRIPKRSSWGWDETSFDPAGNPLGRQFRRVDSYLSDSRVEIDMTPGERDAAKKKLTVSFHRPLQVYFKAFHKAGFTVSRLEEWISHKQSEKGPRSSEEDRVRKEIPMFLMIEAIKQ